MSKDPEKGTEAKPKKGKGKTILMGLMAVLLLGGGGAAGGYFLAGSLGPAHEEAEDPNRPKLIAQDGSEIAVNAAGKPQADVPAGLSEAAFKASYHRIEEPFTSNLKDSSSFAQISLAVSTYYDERVLTNIQTHEMAIRSAVLMVLAEQDASELSTQIGKRALQKRLTQEMNAVLSEKSGFGGIDDIYFTNFVIQ